MKILIKHESRKIGIGTLITSTLMRGPEELFCIAHVIPNFVSILGKFHTEDIAKRVRRDHRDGLIAHYLEIFVDEINL